MTISTGRVNSLTIFRGEGQVIDESGRDEILNGLCSFPPWRRDG